MQEIRKGERATSPSCYLEYLDCYEKCHHI